MNRYFPLYLALLLLTGCASIRDKQIQQIENRNVESVINRLDGPVVIFENGLGGSIDWWAKVLPEISTDVAYYAYNRPGIGASSSVSTPRDGDHIVEELRSNLNAAGLKPPYVLVGHSIGGLYMQLFARKHPGEVQALVLVDSTHPRQLEGDGALEKQSFFVRSALRVLVSGAAKEELEQLNATGEQVLSLPVSTKVKVVVLSAAQPLRDDSAVAQFTNEKRRDIARLYPGSSQIWVDSGHAIPLEKPEAIVNAVRSISALNK